MSIITVVSTDDRVVVAMDTLTMLEDGGQLEMDKFHIIPSMNTLLACRGNGGVLWAAVSRLVPFAASFDDAVNILERESPNIVRQITEMQAQLPTPPARSHPASIAGPQELVLSGWSPLASRIVTLVFRKGDSEMSFSAPKEIRGLYAGPITDEFKSEFAPGWTPEADDDYMRLARAEVACGRGMAPQGLPLFGGRLLKVELKKDNFTCRSLGAL